MSEYYSKVFLPKWADFDPNGHVRGTVYSEFATHLRFMYLQEQGFPMARLQEIKLGPVLFSEETKFAKEIKMDETMRVEMMLSGLSQDASHWQIRHHFYREDNAKAVTLNLRGGWLNLETRKLLAPPEDIAAIVRGITKSADYRQIRSIANLGR